MGLFTRSSIKEYRKNSNEFSIQYTRSTKTRKIYESINELDADDDEEAYVQKPTSEELQDKIKELKERKAHFNGLKKEMEAHGESQVSLTDPDSRSMPKSP